MQAASVMSIRRPTKEERHKVAYYPWWDSHQLRFDGAIAQTGNNGWSEESERPERDAVDEIGEVLVS